MWTAILATLNLTAGTDYDVWSVNTEAEYLEEGEAVEAGLESEIAALTLNEGESASASVPNVREQTRGHRANGRQVMQDMQPDSRDRLRSTTSFE